MSAKIVLISSTPMASLIRIAGHTVPETAMPVSVHYNAICDGTFASVLGLDHEQLVNEAMAEKATGTTLH
jgi:hypothetical protein